MKDMFKKSTSKGFSWDDIMSRVIPRGACMEKKGAGGGGTLIVVQGLLCIA